MIFKVRKVRFTATAREHVRLFRHWWLRLLGSLILELGYAFGGEL
jgi:hypothetical protein